MPIEAIAANVTSSIAIDPQSRAAAGSASGAASSNVFERLLDAASVSNDGANAGVSRMIDGSGDVHDAMIALQQADLMLQLTVQVRNKVVQAYQDIMRMPV